MLSARRCLLLTLVLACSVVARADCASSPLPPFIAEPLTGDGGSFTYNQIVDDWMNAADVTYVRGCTVDGQSTTCLLVPKYSSSTSCTTSDLHADICGLPEEDKSHSHYCMVTDELSQVGMALAMAQSSGAVTRFGQWVNTVKWLRVGTHDGVPAWVARVNAPSGVEAVIESHSNDDASDATARIILALYIAANNTAHAASAAAYEQLANELANLFSMRDFKDTRNRFGGADRFWLAGGRDAASGPLLNTNPYMWAGYYGDCALAMLAAYRATGEERYRDRARDIIANYLRAASFTSAFRVPPTKFVWNDGAAEMSCAGCSSATWDYDDAPRAVSLCKSLRFAIAGGASLDSGVMAAACDYCDAWMESGGVEIGSYRYKPQYSLDGVPQGGFQDGYYEVGLGASLNFHSHDGDLDLRLNQGASRYRPSSKVFTDGSNAEACFGVYRHAFFIVNFGSALGRDLPALIPPLAAPEVTSAMASGSTATVSFTGVPGATGYEISRSCNGETFSPPQAIAGSPFNDTGLTPGATYFYKVRALSGQQRSRFSAMHATRNLPSAPIEARSQAIAAADIQALRTIANELRDQAGLPDFEFTDAPLTSGSTLVKSIHITELRTAITEARTSLGVPSMTFTSAAAPGAVISGSAIDELRQAACACNVLNTRPFTVE